jgi:hypothetical protein
MTEYVESEASHAATRAVASRSTSGAKGAPAPITPNYPTAYDPTPKVSKKSGWNRLFVVISVLWAIGAPIYTMVEANNSTSEIYRMCYSSAYTRYGPGGYAGADEAKFQTAKAQCGYNFDRAFMAPQKLIDILLGGQGPGPNSTAILWGIILVPLALLWLIGGITIRTVRWVAAGFK